MSSLSFEDLGISTKSGRQRYATICPKCNDTRQKHRNAQCLTVNDEPGNRWYKCHHPTCGWSGNLDAGDKYDKVRENSKQPERKAQAYTKSVREYLNKRGFSTKTALAEEVYEHTDGKGRTLICFPFYMNQTLVNSKFFNLSWKPGHKGPKWFQLKKNYGTKTIPWGMQTLKFDVDTPNKLRTVIWTEGEWDMLTWKECGYNNAISVPQGAPSDKAKDFTKEFAYLQDPYVKSVLVDVQMHYLSVDADAPGKVLMDNLAMILGKSKCRIIKYPPGYKDINEVYNGHEKKKLKALGQEGVDECIQNAGSFPLKGVIKASDVSDGLRQFRKKGFTPGLGIGIPEVDRLFTIKRKHLSAIVGIPGSGKSVLARWYVIELIRNNIDQDIKIAMFTPENRPVEREYARIAEVVSGAGFMEDSPNSMSDIQYQKAMRFIEKHFFIIAPDKKNFETFNGEVDAKAVNTMDSILRYVAYLKETENIFMFIIDAFNKLDTNMPRHLTETTFISQQLDRLTDFCDYYDVHCMMIVHPKKIESQGMNYKAPTLYDAKGSSGFKEKIDVGIVLSRQKYRKMSADEMTIQNPTDDDWWAPVYDAPTILRTEKIRFEELGVESRVKLKMDPKRGGRFYVDGKEKEQEKQKAIEQEKINTIFGDMDDENEKLPF
ncbi:hypothetical protein KA005_32800 [bacterium]|nr:hypothetical protein [bacterium]